MTVTDNVRLATLARWAAPIPADGDYLTTDAPLPEPAGVTCQGQLFYIPTDQQPGTHPLYRLYEANLDDHMDSIQLGEAGYAFEDRLGYAYDASDGVTEEIWRWFRPADGRHATAFGEEDLSPQGYQREGILGYGYPRYGAAQELPLVVEGSQVTLVANLAAGGAISELWWQGRQFINQKDYGRLIQIACNMDPTAELDNPTEGGDEYSPPAEADPRWGHGSPLISAEVAGTFLRTACHPLQFRAGLREEPYRGGKTQPVMWGGTFAKEVEVDWHGRPQVIHWTTTVTFPSAETHVDLEIMTAYLNSDFTRLCAFDVSQAAPRLEEVTDLELHHCADPDARPALLQPVAGGVLLATADDAFALGVYRRSAPGRYVGFGLCYLQEPRPDWDPQAEPDERNASNKWSAHHRYGGVTEAGTYSYEAFLLVGTVADVLREARQLYEDGE
jgi:hypothetical protein